MRNVSEHTPTEEIRTTVTLWFSPGAGWRMDSLSGQQNGGSHRITGEDGKMLWDFDPDTNRYTLQPTRAQFSDPRFIALGGEYGATAFTTDLASAVATFQRNPDYVTTKQSGEQIAGRDTKRLTIRPSRCSTSAGSKNPPQGIAATTSSAACAPPAQYWLDATTGWELRADVHDSTGRGFTMETNSATFDAPIDPAKFHFTPPPGSAQVTSLN